MQNGNYLIITHTPDLCEFLPNFKSMYRAAIHFPFPFPVSDAVSNEMNA